MRFVQVHASSWVCLPFRLLHLRPEHHVLIEPPEKESEVPIGVELHGCDVEAKRAHREQ